MVDKRVLIPGWAGNIDDEEVAYIITQLKKRPALREKWGFNRESEKFSAKSIKRLAEQDESK